MKVGEYTFDTKIGGVVVRTIVRRLGGRESRGINKISHFPYTDGEEIFCIKQPPNYNFTINNRYKVYWDAQEYSEPGLFDNNGKLEQNYKLWKYFASEKEYRKLKLEKLGNENL